MYQVCHMLTFVTSIFSGRMIQNFIVCDYRCPAILIGQDFLRRIRTHAKLSIDGDRLPVINPETIEIPRVTANASN